MNTSDTDHQLLLGEELKSSHSVSLSQLQEKVSNFIQNAQKPPLIVVCGPTASGKTSLAVEIALQCKGEVINADSRQVYTDIVIGNALTQPSEMKGVPHHLFSCCPLDTVLSVAEYKRQVDQLILDIHARQHLPLICGGTSLWIDAVVDNFSIPAVKADENFRKQCDQKPLEQLLLELQKKDPKSYEQLKDHKNRRFITRALEIVLHTGKPKSEQAQKGERLYDVLKLAPLWTREKLYQRINKRTLQQVNDGIVEEVEAIAQKYTQGDVQALTELAWPSLTSIGCKEIFPYLQNKINREDLITTLQKNNRHYAKRQLTWLRKDPEINWVLMEE